MLNGLSQADYVSDKNASEPVFRRTVSSEAGLGGNPSAVQVLSVSNIEVKHYAYHRKRTERLASSAASFHYEVSFTVGLGNNFKSAQGTLSRFRIY